MKPWRLPLLLLLLLLLALPAYTGTTTDYYYSTEHLVRRTPSPIRPKTTPTAISTPSAAPAFNHLAVPALVCGNRLCESTFQGYGETCGNCPADCGPCQAASDAVGCVDDLTYAMTFDEGPSWSTPTLLNILAKAGVKGNFFMPTWNLGAFPTYFKNEAAAGHSTFPSIIANATLEIMFWQLYNAGLAFQSAICRRPALYRAPAGLILGTRQRQLGHRLGMRAVLWNIDASSTTNTLNTLTYFEGNLSQIAPRSVIDRQTDASEAYVNLTAAVLTTANSFNYNFVPLEQCLWGKDYVLNPSWVWMNSLCGVNWEVVLANYSDSVVWGPRVNASVNATSICRVSDWSEWSSCDALCGSDGTSTRIRISYPPADEFELWACKDVNFTQLRHCDPGTTCPTYVWNDTYTDTDGSGLTEAAMRYKIANLTVCGFGEWRWTNKSAACSKKCGVGTAVQVRDFLGYGPYSFLCGPMTQTHLCSLRSCFIVYHSWFTISHVMTVLVAAGSIIVLCCVLAAAIQWIRYAIVAVQVVLGLGGTRANKKGQAYPSLGASDAWDLPVAAVPPLPSPGKGQWNRQGYGKKAAMSEGMPTGAVAPSVGYNPNPLITSLVTSSYDQRRQQAAASPPPEWPGPSRKRPPARSQPVDKEEDEEEEEWEEGGPIAPNAHNGTPHVYSKVPAHYFQGTRAVSGSFVVRRGAPTAPDNATVQQRLAETSAVLGSSRGSRGAASAGSSAVTGNPELANEHWLNLGAAGDDELPDDLDLPELPSAETVSGGAALEPWEFGRPRTARRSKLRRGRFNIPLGRYARKGPRRRTRSHKPEKDVPTPLPELERQRSRSPLRRTLVPHTTDETETISRADAAIARATSKHGVSLHVGL